VWLWLAMLLLAFVVLAIMLLAAILPAIVGSYHYTSCPCGFCHGPDLLLPSCGVQVDQNVIAFFEPVAEKLLSSKQPIRVLAAALATMSGFRSVPPAISLLASEPVSSAAVQCSAVHDAADIDCASHGCEMLRLHVICTP
jgi:hypothetical protein